MSMLLLSNRSSLCRISRTLVMMMSTRHIHCSQCCLASTSTTTNDDWSTRYDYMITKCREQARRSVFVKLRNEIRKERLHEILSKYARRTKLRLMQNSKLSYLVEFESVESCDNFIVGAVRHKYGNDTVKLSTSRFLTFKLDGENSSTHETERSPSDDEIRKLLLSAKNVSDQMEKLYELTKQTETDSRLRFLVAASIEDVFRSCCPRVKCIPFGSSVNGFGRPSSDLDLDLHLEDFTSVPKETPFEFSFQFIRENKFGSRRHAQRKLSVIGPLLLALLHGLSSFDFISEARVPIVKFTHDFLKIGCDISYKNPTGQFMSKILRTCTEIDRRFAPLVFAVQLWAKSNGLTRTDPGTYLSNFQLLLLTCFYLQNSPHGQILPGFSQLFKNTNGSRLTLVGDKSLRAFSANAKKNNRYLKNLLLGFFDFYSTFNFQHKSLSLNSTFVKHLHAGSTYPMFFNNPFENEVNMTKNVDRISVRVFQEACRQAGTLAASSINQTPNSSQWGLLNFFNMPVSSNVNHLTQFHKSASNANMVKADNLDEKSLPNNSQQYVHQSKSAARNNLNEKSLPNNSQQYVHQSKSVARNNLDEKSLPSNSLQSILKSKSVTKTTDNLDKTLNTSQQQSVNRWKSKRQKTSHFSSDLIMKQVTEQLLDNLTNPEISSFPEVVLQKKVTVDQPSNVANVSDVKEHELYEQPSSEFTAIPHRAPSPNKRSEIDVTSLFHKTRAIDTLSDDGRDSIKQSEIDNRRSDSENPDFNQEVVFCKPRPVASERSFSPKSDVAHRTMSNGEVIRRITEQLVKNLEESQISSTSVIESPENLPSRQVESPENLPSRQVESPENLPSRRVESPENLPSRLVESPENLPSRQVESIAKSGSQETPVDKYSSHKSTRWTSLVDSDDKQDLPVTELTDLSDGLSIDEQRLLRRARQRGSGGSTAP